jgi:hypothetical protein
MNRRRLVKAAIVVIVALTIVRLRRRQGDDPVTPTELPVDNIGLGMGPALRARYGTIGGPSPFEAYSQPESSQTG